MGRLLGVRLTGPIDTFQPTPRWLLDLVQQMACEQQFVLFANISHTEYLKNLDVS